MTFSYDEEGTPRINRLKFHGQQQALDKLGQHLKLWGTSKEDSAEVQQRNNFLVFINAMQSGELDHIVERITGVKLPPPPGKEVIDVVPSGPRKARD